MHLIVHLFGREVLRVSTDPEPAGELEHDHLAAQVELAEPAPIGFHIPANPSLAD